MNESFFNFNKSNPFSTRFVAPGRIPFFFDRSFLRLKKAAHQEKFEEFFADALGAGEDISNTVSLRFIIDQFETFSCRGQVVGAHGTGKSTLMHYLKESLTNVGYDVFSWELHDQQRFLPDVFWLELQSFLRSSPKFLPSKCLLPPPVVSRDDYLAQQRESLRSLFGDSNMGHEEDDDETFDEIETVEEFQARGLDESESSVPFSSAASSKESSTVARKDVHKRASGFLGFNSAGNFGLNHSLKEVDAPTSVSEEPVAFAPFPGVTSLSEGTNADRASEDEIATPSLTEAILKEQKKLAIPLPVDYDLSKNRSFFEKKVVFFDGFEQLSYVNRIVLRTFCRMNHLGLLIATHTPAIGIPVLFRTSPSVETLRQVLDFLLEDSDLVPDDSDLRVLLKNFNNDVREILFSLYDAYEKYRWAPREVREKIVRRYPR